MDEVWEFIQEVGQERDHCSYDIDGVVIKVNDSSWSGINLVLQLKRPKWAVAYSSAEEKEVNLLVDWTVGRTGCRESDCQSLLQCTGSTTARSCNASWSLNLHAEKDIREAWWYSHVVYKAGDIIPAVFTCRRIKACVRGETRYSTTVQVGESKLLYLKMRCSLRCINPRCPAQIQRRFNILASQRCHEYLWPRSINL